MSIAVEIFPVMPARPCRICLSLQGGSVFADFDTDDSDMVFLRRISYDGFGCCNIKGSISKMTADDSRLLLDAIARGEPESVQIEEILRKYFRTNKDLIWSDALERHHLL